MQSIQYYMLGMREAVVFFGDNNKGGDGKKYEAHASFCLACRCFGRGETGLGRR
jgi:hypothetical protein